jgi:hypothetical protein
MKIAAYLSLAVALVLGGWSAIDYHHNEQLKDLVSLELMATIAAHSGEGRAHQDLNDVLGDERYDGIVGIVAAVFLMGGIVLISQGKKVANA